VPLGTVKKTLAGVEIPAAALLAAKKLAPPAVAAVSVIIRFFLYIRHRRTNKPMFALGNPPRLMFVILSCSQILDSLKKNFPGEQLVRRILNCQVTKKKKEL
jgi:hypothetical protein